jgi:hypothetical protein
MLPRISNLFLLALLPCLLSATTAFEPTDSYQQRTLEGWNIRISTKLQDNPDLTSRVLDLLRVRLFEINRVLPDKALGRLRDISIWIELNDRRFPGMCFHPSKDWLSAHNYNPDKAGSIQIGNAHNFLNWSDQPAMVLHEVAHAYHHTVLGVDQPELRAAHKAARDSGKYDAVLRDNGRTERAYALNNAEEFFAELSECYFLTNDFFPFVSAELKEHDLKNFELIKKLWNTPPVGATLHFDERSRVVSPSGDSPTTQEVHTDAR